MNLDLYVWVVVVVNKETNKTTHLTQVMTVALPCGSTIWQYGVGQKAESSQDQILKSFVAPRL